MLFKNLKLSLAIVLGLTLFAFMSFFYLGYHSQKKSSPGLFDQQLQACPTSPNCVCSDGDSANIEALYIGSSNLNDPIKALIPCIEKMGGVVKTYDETYLATEFKSKLFKFVDDLEIRYDVLSQKLHFRSASRVGHSDMGVNEKRVRELKALIKELL